MRKNKIAKAEQHFLVSCCLHSIFENIKTTDKNTKKVIERLIARNEQLKNTILKYKFSDKELNRLQRKANKIALIYKDFLDYDIVIFQKALLIIIDESSVNIPNTEKYKTLKNIYKYLQASSFTLFNHLDRILKKESKNWETFRIMKAEMLAKKMLTIIKQ